MNAVVLINVVVAVLLDGMSAQPADVEEEATGGDGEDVDANGNEMLVLGPLQFLEVNALRDQIKAITVDLTQQLAGVGLPPVAKPSSSGAIS